MTDLKKEERKKEVKRSPEREDFLVSNCHGYEFHVLVTKEENRVHSIRVIRADSKTEEGWESNGEISNDFSNFLDILDRKNKAFTVDFEFGSSREELKMEIKTNVFGRETTKVILLKKMEVEPILRAQMQTLKLESSEKDDQMERAMKVIMFKSDFDRRERFALAKMTEFMDFYFSKCDASPMFMWSFFRGLR
jgi:hypothetical protein